eukprot:m.15482 g.15482  ORF g.15482 m.15482 type:complete len:238 (+) comp7857_c0_seq1:107-820(+)
MEFITPEGLRGDGRRATDLRRVQASVGLFPEADGSAYIEQGQTKVLTIVNGPKQGSSGTFTIECEFEMASFSSTFRQKRSYADRKSTELGTKIADTFANVILNDLYPKSRIDISVQVLQADGGTLAAAINATTLALMDAGVAMKDFVCACTASVIDGTCIADINHTETMARGPELTLAVLPKSETIVMNEMTSRVHVDLYGDMQKLAIAGCEKIQQLLKEAITQRTVNLIPALGPPA